MNSRFPFQYSLLAGFVVVILITLTFTGFLLHYQLKPSLIAQHESSLNQQIISLREVIGDRWSPELPARTVDLLADEMGRKLNLRVTLIGPDGVVLGDSQVRADKLSSLDNHGKRPEVLEALTGELGASIRHSATLGLDQLYVAGLLADPENPRLVIRLSLPLAEVKKTLLGVRQRILVVSLLGVLLSLTAAYLVALKITRPLRELTRTTRLITAGKHSSRVRRYPPNEIGVLGRAFDRMTDHLEEEIDRAKEGRERIEGILRAMVEGVLVLDREGRIVMSNQAAEGLFDLTPGSRGRRISEVVRQSQVVDTISLVLAGLPYANEEIWTVGPDRRALNIHAVRLEAGSSGPGSVVVFNDVTELKKTDEIRRDFVANLSHDIRTPLAAIRGAVETIQAANGQALDQSGRFLNMIARQVNRLQVLSEDLLSLASLERGQEGAEFMPEEAGELLEASLSAVKSLARDKGVALVSEPPKEEIALIADRARLEEALVNLIDNAVKYTEPKGTITVSCSALGDEVRFVVADTGPGIPTAHQDRIFERFYRVDKARSREKGGTGLGLAIVKHAAGLHGGRVEVESTEGKGSVFTLVVPIEGPSPKKI